MTNAISPAKERFSDFAFGPMLSFGVLGLLSAFLFVVTQSMLSGGEVMPNNVAQWFVGFVPVVTILVWSIGHSENHLALSRAGIVGWNFSLLVFVLVHELHYANSLQSIFFGVLGYDNRNLVEFILCGVYAVCGVVVSQLTLRLGGVSRRQRKDHSVRYSVELLILNCVLFAGFVYRLIF